jgi:shikimate-5-dehydrogenase
MVTARGGSLPSRSYIAIYSLRLSRDFLPARKDQATPRVLSTDSNELSNNIINPLTMTTASAERPYKIANMNERATTSTQSAAQRQHSSPPTQKLYIFGKGISFSKSPHMHNAGFAYHGLNHHYSIREVDDVSECAPFIRSADFKGASVTMPYKLQIAAFCGSVTDEARLIGAVNTLSVHRASDGKRTICGDNTDWSGLLQCIQTRYPGYDAAHPPKVGWVIGAGGASRAAVYALHRSGVEQIYISNRTFERAEKIAADFAGHFRVVPIEKWEEMNGHPANVIIGTVPADTVNDSQFAGIEWKGEGGLCIDMSYKPRVTPLMRIAQDQEGWATANGLDALLEQGLIQYKIWTGLDAPRDVMSAAIQ